MILSRVISWFKYGFMKTKVQKKPERKIVDWASSTKDRYSEWGSDLFQANEELIHRNNRAMETYMAKEYKEATDELARRIKEDVDEEILRAIKEGSKKEKKSGTKRTKRPVSKGRKNRPSKPRKGSKRSR